MIAVQRLTKEYKGKKAVDDISFTVETGKVTGFLGPNGAGKSTTMRLMLGLDHGAGSTTYDGKPLTGYANPSKVVGILLEAKSFHPTRSARAHIKSLALLGDVPRKRVDEVLDMVGLAGVAKKSPGKFSLGMSQRLGLAAAILSKPRYLILDEPANGLDPEGIKWLRNFLEDYASQGNAVFVSSHLLAEMSLMADNIIVIGQGKLIANTSTKELLARGTHKSTRVRANNMRKLQALLKQAGEAYEIRDDCLLIHGKTTDEIGQIITPSDLTILELSGHSASLEEIFLELTAEQQEYHAKVKKGKRS